MALAKLVLNLPDVTGRKPVTRDALQCFKRELRMSLWLLHAGPERFDMRRIVVIGPNSDDDAAEAKHFAHSHIVYDVICISQYLFLLICAVLWALA